MAGFDSPQVRRARAGRWLEVVPEPGSQDEDARGEPESGSVRDTHDGTPDAAPDGFVGDLPDGAVRDALEVAVRTRRVVRIDYQDQSGGRTSRNVEAHGLVIAPYGEYLAGWCMLRDAARLFRLDRIDAAAVTARPAGVRARDELLSVLRYPAAPRGAAGAAGAPRGGTAGGAPGGSSPAGRARPPARSRAWALARVEQVRDRLAGAIQEAATGGGPADPGEDVRLRVLLCHLAEWCRWQMAAVQAVFTGGELVFTGNRPPFPAEFDGPLPYARRERMIQDAMGARSLTEVAGDLDAVLAGAARWISGSDEVLWRADLPDPAAPQRRRPLADLIAGWWSPISHIEWHLDRDHDRGIDLGVDGEDGAGEGDSRDDGGAGPGGAAGEAAGAPPIVAECPLGMSGPHAR